MILRAQLFALVLGLFSTHAASFLFDAEEIKSLNYAVEIVDQPVLITEELDPLTVRMLNKHGQPYACRLPEPAPPPGERSERPEEAADPSALLAPMALGPCLQRTRDWWTYELCPRAGIRQFHIEGGQIVGEVSSLGRFESDYDWGQDDGRSRNAKQRYHSQQYTNGSDCDLTGRPRSSEVRYVCEEGGEDTLVRVDEPETCRYLLTVRTARVCRHRLLAPPVQQRPQPLTCRPQLSAHQLQLLAEAQQRRRSSWTAAQAAEEAQEEVEIETGEGEADEQWQFQEDSAADDAVGGDTGGDEKTAAQMEGSAGTSEDNVEEVVKGLFSGVSEAMIDEKLEESHPLSVLRRWLRQQEGATDAKQLKHTQELFEAIETQTQKMAKVLDDVLAGFRAISADMRADSSHLIALSRRHTAARRIQSARAARIRELLGAGDQGANPAQIVKELLMYTGTLNVFSEVTLALTEETGRLQQLVRQDPDRLGFHAIETVLTSMSKLLRFSQHVRLFYTQTKAVRTALLAMSDSPEEEEQEEDWEAAGAGLASEDAEPASSGAGERSGAANDDDDVGAAASEQEDLISGEATARETDRKKGKRQLKFSTLEALGLDKMVQVSSIDRAQRNRIEAAVRQKLSKIGLDPSGPEIKMRLLKYPDSSGVEKEHTLSDFEMAAFEKALITIMVGGQQALAEHDRQQRLERNYDYNFAETLRGLETAEPEEEPETKPPDALFTLV